MSRDGQPVECISAVTLTVSDMETSVSWYTALGFTVAFGGVAGAFTCLRAGTGFLNLQLSASLPTQPGTWGRIVLWVDDVDAMFDRAIAARMQPEMPPSDAPWGERYFHLRDPDGHELSFARPLVRPLVRP